MVKKLPLILQFGHMGFDSGFFPPCEKSLSQVVKRVGVLRWGIQFLLEKKAAILNLRLRIHSCSSLRAQLRSEHSLNLSSSTMILDKLLNLFVSLCAFMWNADHCNISPMVALDSFIKEVLMESPPHAGHWVGSLHTSGREEVRLTRCC